MNHRITLLCFVAFLAGIGSSQIFNRTTDPAAKLRTERGIPDVIEVYRPVHGDLPAVADTVRVLRWREKNEELAIQTGVGRPEWVVRMRFGRHVVCYWGEAINYPPG